VAIATRKNISADQRRQKQRSEQPGEVTSRSLASADARAAQVQDQAGISRLQCSVAARYPIRTRIHSRAGKSPRGLPTWRPGRRRKSRYRTRALPPYCKITCSVLRGQFRLGDRVSGWSVTGGVGTLCGSRLHATSAVLETGYRLTRLFRRRDSLQRFSYGRISHRGPNSAHVLHQEKVRTVPDQRNTR